MSKLLAVAGVVSALVIAGPAAASHRAHSHHHGHTAQGQSQGAGGSSQGNGGNAQGDSGNGAGQSNGGSQGNGHGNGDGDGNAGPPPYKIPDCTVHGEHRGQPDRTKSPKRWCQND